jgi:hypothetical protein
VRSSRRSSACAPGTPTAEELQARPGGRSAGPAGRVRDPVGHPVRVPAAQFYNLPLDWYAGYQQRLKAVDTKAVRKAAEKHLRAKDFVVLVVGDAAKVLPDLDAIAKEQLFGKGGVVVLDADGKPTARP